MKKYSSFSLYRKKNPADKLSGFGSKVVHGFGQAAIILWVLFTIALISWVILASFTPTKDIFQNKLLTKGFDFTSYDMVLNKYSMSKYFLNSVIYTTCACLGLIFLCAPAAFVMSKFTFRGKTIFQSMFSISLGLPGVMLLAPLYMMLIKLNMNGHSGTLIIVYICTGIASTTVFLMGFFATVPMTVFESGLIDGCSHVQSFWKLILPLAQPGIMTITIFNFIAYWNEYIWALTLASKKENRTLAVGLQTLVTSMSTTGNYTGLFAGVVIVFIPTMIIYMFLSKKIMSGITSGAVKG